MGPSQLADWSSGKLEAVNTNLVNFSNMSSFLVRCNNKSIEIGKSRSFSIMVNTAALHAANASSNLVEAIPLKFSPLRP